MSFHKYADWFKSFYRYLAGDENNKQLSEYSLLLDEIRRKEISITNLSDRGLKEKFGGLKKQVEQGENPNYILPEVYAIVCEVIFRSIRLRPFDVQILGAIALQNSMIIEMPTGEGKTMVAVFPAVLNAMKGLGVHILTFNDYLAERDAGWMGQVFEFLGLTVGFVKEGMSSTERRSGYEADITYLSAKEAGFDYLRDTMHNHKHEIVQRPFHFAIIDEADSILIDEARIPLVIAGSSNDSFADTYRIAQVAKKLQKDIDYDFDEYERNFHLTEEGITKVEKELQCENIYEMQNFDLLTRLNCAIHAEALLTNGVDYIVREQRIELVDEFTGRVADKRRWPDGIQAALEAKENIAQQNQGEILNTITLQHFMSLYPKMCGMTGTAVPARSEFRRFYNLDVLVIPPNKPCIREDFPDVVFSTKAQKEQAVIDEIINTNRIGRPVLIGTSSVRESERLAARLKVIGVKCEVLNARNDHYEAHIIAQTGKPGAITISTNMAGRGIDIRLGGSDENEKNTVLALNGLYVIGTNKHESQRIDKQLRGRSGRQGEPGASRFFISLEDDLFMRYNLKDLLPKKLALTNLQETSANKILSNEINRIQRIVEGQNLEIKKTLQNYSGIIDKQRIILFRKRRQYLNVEEASKFFKSQREKEYKRMAIVLGKEKITEVAKTMMLYYIDEAWIQYLSYVAELRESIHLRRIGGQNPLFEFQKAVIKKYDEMLASIDQNALKAFEKITVTECQNILHGEKFARPSATWTYLVNDNSFENLIGLQMIDNIGMQIGASMLGGVFILRELHRKFHKRKNR